MKKVLAPIIAAVMLLMTACYNDGRGTYFPSWDEMEKNLDAKGYTVIVEDKDVGKYLNGHKDDDYIEFYWLDNADDAKKLNEELSKEHTDFDELRSILNSDEHGNVLFCSKGSAMDDAGIQIVEVDVKV